MAQQPPLLRDVINIKESISTSDFVLQLSEATTPEGAELALRDYVVTERLLENFDEALGLIKASLDGHTSKAAYLHGSFGSGKSHFMAVLHALLSGSPAAHRRSDFDSVLAKHEWLSTDGKKFLLVPYHMLGAKALEQRVLGTYVSHVKKLHPEAPTPASTAPTPSSPTSMRCASGWATRPLSRGSAQSAGRLTRTTSGVSPSPGPLPSSTPRSPPRRSTRPGTR